MKSGFKHRITGLLFSMAAGLGAASVMSGPLSWPGAPKPPKGSMLKPTGHGESKGSLALRDSYGVIYERSRKGVIRRVSERISLLSRAERKAIWSGKVAA